MTLARVAEIRQENHGGDVSYRDIDWLCDAVVRLERERDEAHRMLAYAVHTLGAVRVSARLLRELPRDASVERYDDPFTGEIVLRAERRRA